MTARSTILTSAAVVVFVVVPVAVFVGTCYWFVTSLLPSFSASFSGATLATSSASSLASFEQPRSSSRASSSPKIAPSSATSSIASSEKGKKPSKSSARSSVGVGNSSPSGNATFVSRASRFSVSYPENLIPRESGASVNFFSDGREVFTIVTAPVPRDMTPLTPGDFASYVRRTGIEEMGYRELVSDISFTTASQIPCRLTVWSVDADGAQGSLVFCYADAFHAYQLFVFDQAYAKRFMNLVLSLTRE